MTSRSFNSWAQPAIRVAAAGLGAAIAGPLGGAVGGWLGAALGGASSELLKSYAHEFGDKAAEKLTEIGTDSLIEKMKSSSPDLESVYREALRLSLLQIQADRKLGFCDWFANWSYCLRASVPLDLSPIRPDQLVPANLDYLFRLTLEQLDAQGTALRQKNLSLQMTCRVLPDVLLSELDNRLPECLEENFRALIVKPEYEHAWKQTQLILQKFSDSALRRLNETTQRIDRRTDVLPQVAEDTAAIRKIVEGFFISAVNEGRVTDAQLQAKDAEVARLSEELRKLQEQLTARASEPSQAQLSKLLAAGDLSGALYLKTKQVETRKGDTGKSPRDCFELGMLHELRSDWPKALAAYREAWRLECNREYGFKYAYFARRQNHFPEAIGVYETLRDIEKRAVVIAAILNNLAPLYRATQQLKEAELAYREALSIRRKLVQTDPDTNLSALADTLNNLANLYRDMQRLKEAEEAYCEALSIRRNLVQTDPNHNLIALADTLNNIASLYRATQRIKEAEEAYREALSIRRNLAQADPGAHLPRLANTLNNVADLCSHTQRMKEAEKAYSEALSIRRELARANPEAYLPNVAMTLNNLASLYRTTRRFKEAEKAYREALYIRRKAAQANPEAYLQDVAMTLNNLANLWSNTERIKEAEEAYREALIIYRDLAINPETYLSKVVVTLNNLAILYHNTQRIKESEAACREAEDLLEPRWRVHPELHGNQMARILFMRAQSCKALGKSSTEALGLARNAFNAAVSIDFKQRIERFISQLCVGSQGSCEGDSFPPDGSPNDKLDVTDIAVDRNSQTQHE